jgi:hypothetical protein
VQFLVSISAEFCVQVRHFDIIEQLVSILEDPKLQDGFMDSPDVQGTGDDRVRGAQYWVVVGADTRCRA